MITGTWFFDDKYNCWCLEDVPYTERPTSPRYQQLSIFVPAPYMSAPGVVDEQGRFGPYTSRTVPVVFENNSTGYMQMPRAATRSNIWSAALCMSPAAAAAASRGTRKAG